MLDINSAIINCNPASNSVLIVTMLDINLTQAAVKKYYLKVLIVTMLDINRMLRYLYCDGTVY